MFPLCGVGDLESRADHNFAETITELGLADCATGFHLKVSEVELNSARDALHGGGEAPGEGSQEEFFWSPAAFESSKLFGSGEVNGVGAESDWASPDRPEVHHAATRYACSPRC